MHAPTPAPLLHPQHSPNTPTLTRMHAPTPTHNHLFLDPHALPMARMQVSARSRSIAPATCRRGSAKARHTSQTSTSSSSHSLRAARTGHARASKCPPSTTAFSQLAHESAIMLAWLCLVNLLFCFLNGTHTVKACARQKFDLVLLCSTMVYSVLLAFLVVLARIP
jgi:hypothetical protein